MTADNTLKEISALLNKSLENHPEKNKIVGFALGLITKYAKEHSALKEQEVVAWLCEYEGKVSQIFHREESMEYYKNHGYTVTELVKK